MEIWKKMWVGVFFWTQCDNPTASAHEVALAVGDEHSLATEWEQLEDVVRMCMYIQRQTVRDIRPRVADIQRAANSDHRAMISDLCAATNELAEHNLN